MSITNKGDAWNHNRWKNACWAAAKCFSSTGTESG